MINSSALINAHVQQNPICFGSFSTTTPSTINEALSETEAIATKVALCCLDGDSAASLSAKPSQYPRPKVLSILRKSLVERVGESLPAEEKPPSRQYSVKSELNHKALPFQSSLHLAQLSLHYLSDSHKCVSRVLPKALSYFYTLSQEGKMAQGEELKNAEMVAKTAAMTAICAKIIVDLPTPDAQSLPNAIRVCQTLCKELVCRESQSQEVTWQITEICKIIGSLQREDSLRYPRTLTALISEQAAKRTSREKIEQIEQHDQFLQLYGSL